jgi:hypothetical protein
MAAGQNPYQGLRDMALHLTAEKLGLHPAESETVVLGIVMDMGLPQGTATLVSFATGDTSLYLSSGGGIIGGRGHEAVRLASEKWLSLAREKIGLLNPSTDFDLPPVGDVQFFVLTNHGVLTAMIKEADATSGTSPLAPLWLAGQYAFTAMRRSKAKPS